MGMAFHGVGFGVSNSGYRIKNIKASFSTASAETLHEGLGLRCQTKCAVDLNSDCVVSSMFAARIFAGGNANCTAHLRRHYGYAPAQAPFHSGPKANGQPSICEQKFRLTIDNRSTVSGDTLSTILTSSMRLSLRIIEEVRIRNTNLLHFHISIGECSTITGSKWQCLCLKLQICSNIAT